MSLKVVWHAFFGKEKRTAELDRRQTTLTVARSLDRRIKVRRRFDQQNIRDRARPEPPD